MSTKVGRSTPKFPQWAKSAAREIGQDAGALYADPRTAELPALNPNTLAGINRRAQIAQSGSTVGGAAGDEAMRILRGEYLDPTKNPNFQRAMGAAMGAASSRFAGSGRVGSGAYAGALGDAATGVAGQMYDAERQRMLGTLSLTPQLIAGQYADSAALEDAGRAMDEDAMARFDWPYARLDRYANTLYANPMLQMPGTSTKQPFSWGGAALGLLAPFSGAGQAAYGG